MYFLRKKNVMASIAQVILAVILLPMVCIILKAIMPEDAISFFLNMVGELPVWGELTDIIVQLIVEINSGSSTGSLLFYSAMIRGIQNGMIEAAILGMCVYACKAIGTMVYIRGIPVLQALSGILLGTLTIKAMENDDVIKYMSLLFLVILNIVLTFFEASGQLLKKISGVVIGMGFQIMIAGFSAGYVLVLAYILLGSVRDPQEIVVLLTNTLLPLIVFLCLDYVLFTAIKP